MASPNLIIRADASLQMGTGHAMRCLALAQAWQERGGCVYWVTRELPETMVQRIRAEKIEIIFHEHDPGQEKDAEALDYWEQEYAAWVTVVDGYHLNRDSFWSNRRSQVPVLWVDDLGGNFPTGVEWVLNQNLYADRGMYESTCDQTAGYLLGPRYSLLRREFYPGQDTAEEEVVDSSASRILITFGGADPVNMTGYLLEAVEMMAEGVDVDVVVGGANPRAEEYQAFMENRSGRVHIHRDVNTMSNFIQRSDLIIGPTGSSHLEFIHHGKYAVYFTLADNGRRVAASIRDLGLGVAFDLGEKPEQAELRSLLKEIRYDGMAKKVQTYGPELVDGTGAFRVVDELLGKELRFRPAHESDRDRLLAWVNDPVVRQASFTQAIITEEEHAQWFERRLQDPQSTLWIVVVQGSPRGIIRWQHNNQGVAVVSVLLDSQTRGKGWGKKVITSGCQRYLGESPATTRIEAYIRLDNEASKKAFQVAGFTMSEPAQVEGQNAECLILENPGGNIYANRNT